MKKITLQDLTRSSDDFFSWVTEASRLEISPGEPWPEEFTVPQSEIGGNGLPFVAQKALRGREGEFQGIQYRQDFGILRITIFND